MKQKSERAVRERVEVFALKQELIPQTEIIENIAGGSTTKAKRDYEKAVELLRRLVPFDGWYENCPYKDFVDKHGGPKIFYDRFKSELEGVVAECKARMKAEQNKHLK